uniref:Dpy-30 histone methyltransferase complex regulatory subunit n=1 Tax=Mola mola TaxID=94237 RepID=A0A3Q3WL30_MOLML
MENIERMVDNEKGSTKKKSKQRVNLQALPTKAYLDETVVPILLQGLSVLAKDRPPNSLTAHLLPHESSIVHNFILVL